MTERGKNAVIATASGGVFFPLFASLVVAVTAWFLGRNMAANVLREASPVSPPLAALAAAQFPSTFTTGDPATPAVFQPAAWIEAVHAWRAVRSPARRAQRLVEMTRGFAPGIFPIAMEALSGAVEGHWRERRHLLEIWAVQDLASARAWLEAQDASLAGMFHLRCAVAKVWAKQDGSGFLRWLKQQPPETRVAWVNASAPEDTLATLAQGDPRGTLSILPEYAKTHGPGAKVLEIWAQRDPLAAADEAMRAPTAEVRRAFVGGVIAGWAGRDVAAAAAWIQRLDDSALADAAWQQFFRPGVIQKAPEETLRILVEIAPAKALKDFVASVTAAIARQNPEEALALAARQADDTVRRALIEQTIRAVAADDPQRAVALWQREDAHGSGASGMIETLTEALTRHGGIGAARRFLDTLPADNAETAQQAAAGVARFQEWSAVADAALQMPFGIRRESWLAQSLEALTRDGEIAAAQRLLARLPAGAEKDKATATIAATWLRDDPEPAVRWLLNLPGGHGQLVAQTEKWLAQDRGLAAAWISATAFLSADEKQRLLATP